MIPVKQQYRHNPPETYGDCHRACYASILELPIDAVPHFVVPLPGEVYGDNLTHCWQKREREWLESRGLVPVVNIFDGAQGLQSILNRASHHNPRIYWILGGTSRNESGHSVVVCGGIIVHDPSLDNSGIVGPMKGGYYWSTYIGAAT